MKLFLTLTLYLRYTGLFDIELFDIYLCVNKIYTYIELN